MPRHGCELCPADGADPLPSEPAIPVVSAKGDAGVTQARRQHGAMDTAPRWFVLISIPGGSTLYWHRAGIRHTLSQALGAHWIANFKPALFQVMPDGAIVPRDSQPGGLEILGVSLEAAPLT